MIPKIYMRLFIIYSSFIFPTPTFVSLVHMIPKLLSRIPTTQSSYGDWLIQSTQDPTLWSTQYKHHFTDEKTEKQKTVQAHKGSDHQTQDSNPGRRIPKAGLSVLFCAAGV